MSKENKNVMRKNGNGVELKTIRQQMVVLLSEQEMSARELSQAIGIREKEVYDHLSHISRSLNSQRKRLILSPAQCLSCGFIFKDRTRLTRPGRCPHCKKSHIQIPTYQVL